VNRYIETVSRQTGIAVTATNVGSSANQKLPYSPKRTAPLLETLRKAILKRAGLSTHSQNENSWKFHVWNTGLITVVWSFGRIKGKGRMNGDARRRRGVLSRILISSTRRRRSACSTPVRIPAPFRVDSLALPTYDRFKHHINRLHTHSENSAS